MTVRTVLELGDPKLKAENKRVANINDPAIKQLITDLKDTMYDRDLIGIAAPQIGENYKVFITEPRETEMRENDQSDILRIYINPEIVDSSDEDIIIYEGCGCMPHSSIFGPVSRPRWIKVKAIDETGKTFTFKADGILGRVIQHELDHLDGIEFIQKVTDNSKFLGFDHYVEQIKGTEWHLENCLVTINEYRN